MMFLITGVGRSGTAYMAAVLRAAGLDVGHERLGRDGVVSWFYSVDADSYPPPADVHPAPRPRFDTILHQVREPLACISSLTTIRVWNWAWRFTGLSEDEPNALRRACYMYLAFNEAAERQASMTYQIEYLAHYWPVLQVALGFDADYDDVAGIPRLHRREHAWFGWSDIAQAAPEIYGQLRDMADRYGYEYDAGA